jgi:peroxiredoxin
MPLSPGSSAPPATARDVEGGACDLASLAAAGPALLFFYKGECGTSAVAAPVLPRFTAIPGLSVAAISQDDVAATRAFARAHGWDGSAVSVRVDPEPWPASEAFGVRVTPTFALLAPGGRIDRVEEGWSRDAANALAARAAALVGAPPPVVSRPEDGGPAFRPG